MKSIVVQKMQKKMDANFRERLGLLLLRLRLPCDPKTHLQGEL
jgi:hypothetical protein